MKPHTASSEVLSYFMNPKTRQHEHQKWPKKSGILGNSGFPSSPFTFVLQRFRVYMASLGLPQLQHP